MNALISANKGIPRTGRVIRILAQLLGYYQSESAATAAAYSGGGAGAAQELEPKSVTHRFRLFKCEGLEPNQFIYAEVWDSSEEPLDDSDLPEGNPIKEVSHSSLAMVEEEADRYCQTLGSVQIADWRDIGSI